MRFTGKDGKVQHAAMQHTDGSIFMMGIPDRSIRAQRSLADDADEYVTVDNVDKHYARAKKGGAKIIEKLNETFYGDRRYTTEDPEGHQWAFAQHVRDVSDAEMKKAARELEA
jgi:uncharacterized glyoxalase superfamily protein PhnB